VTWTSRPRAATGEHGFPDGYLMAIYDYN